MILETLELLPEVWRGGTWRGGRGCCGMYNPSRTRGWDLGEGFELLREVFSQRQEAGDLEERMELLREGCSQRLEGQGL